VPSQNGRGPTELAKTPADSQRGLDGRQEKLRKGWRFQSRTPRQFRILMHVGVCLPAYLAPSCFFYRSPRCKVSIAAKAAHASGITANTCTDYSVSLRTASAPPLAPSARQHTVLYKEIRVFLPLPRYDSKRLPGNAWVGQSKAAVASHRLSASLRSPGIPYCPWHADSTGWQAVTSLPKQTDGCYALLVIVAIDVPRDSPDPSFLCEKHVWPKTNAPIRARSKSHTL
jgi:hypothetical protein